LAAPTPDIGKIRGGLVFNIDKNNKNIHHRGLSAAFGRSQMTNDECRILNGLRKRSLQEITLCNVSGTENTEPEKISKRQRNGEEEGRGRQKRIDAETANKTQEHLTPTGAFCRTTRTPVKE
jgi:hypothetical protein